MEERKRRSNKGTCGEPRKKRKKSRESDFQCCVNELYSSTELCKGLQENWKYKNIYFFEPSNYNSYTIYLFLSLGIRQNFKIKVIVKQLISQTAIVKLTFSPICLLAADGLVELIKDPFQCCIMKDFMSVEPLSEESLNGHEKAVSSSRFLDSLEEELLKLKFYEKNNDLYQFHQVWSNHFFL